MNLRTKRVLIFILVVVASAALTSFLLFASSSGVQIQTSRAPFLNRIFSFFVNSSMVTTVHTNPPAAAEPVATPVTPSAPPTSAHQPVPAGFKGPTGAPHINGPTSNPPNY